MQNKLIIISGCSGGGKSTLVSELEKQGYFCVPEVGREIVKEERTTKGNRTPWENPQAFCERLVEKSLDAYHQAKSLPETQNHVVFFDRSFLEGISYFQTLHVHDYDHFVHEFRYFQTVFMAPPWEEIYCQDDERKHTFENSVEKYERIIKFYEKSDYKIITIPKKTVMERVQFLTSFFDIEKES